MSTDSALRYEAALKVTGSAVFEVEVPVAGMLHAALVETPISCGDVVSVDATPASTLPGFAAMVSHGEAEALQPSAATALIRERAIHFAGQPVALVTASTWLEARLAAGAIRIVTRARPAVTGMAQALEKAFAPAAVGRFAAESQRGDSDQMSARLG